MIIFFIFVNSYNHGMLLVNINELVGIDEEGSLMKKGAEMSKTGRIKNAFLLTKGKKILDFGPMDSPECKRYLQTIVCMM